MKDIVIGLILFFLGITSAFGLSLLRTQKPIFQLPIPPTAFSIENAPRDSIKGNVSTSSGKILWLSRIATQPAELNNILIQQGETLIASDTGKITVTFDKNSLSLAPKTELEIIQTLPNQLVFNQKTGTATYSGLLSVRALHLLCEINGAATLGINKSLIKLAILSGSAKIAYNDLNFDSHVLEVSKSFTFEDSFRQVVK